MNGLDLVDLGADLRLVAESARAVVKGDGALDRIRKLRFHAPGFDRAMMRTIAENGWPLLRLESERGGLGMGASEWCTLMRVLGGGLVPEPVLGTILGCALLGDAVPQAVLNGDEILCTAWQDTTNSLRWQGGSTGNNLAGKKVHVPGSQGADWFAVVTADGVALVHRDAPGLTISIEETLDGCRYGHLNFGDLPVTFHAGADVSRLLDEAILAQAAYLLGLSEQAFAITLGYLRLRNQFDKPIGSFQALQHRATDIRIQLDLLLAAVMATAKRIDQGVPETLRQRDVSRCKRRAADLALHLAGEVVQMHGAMGITDEADIGLFVRKAMVEANIFGSARVHRTRLAGLPEEVTI